jgi:hypothetical protein
MKTKLALGAVAAAIAVFSQGAFAQASSPTRADVKAEARKGGLAPAGEGPGTNPEKSQQSTMSDKSRADRKATTKADRASGALKPAGEGAEAKDDKAEKSKATTTDRAMRKADTKAAVKARTTQPAGEAPTPSAEAPKK